MVMNMTRNGEEGVLYIVFTNYPSHVTYYLSSNEDNHQTPRQIQDQQQDTSKQSHYNEHKTLELKISSNKEVTTI